MDIEIRYIPGQYNIAVDALSRMDLEAKRKLLKMHQFKLFPDLLIHISPEKRYEQQLQDEELSSYINYLEVKPEAAETILLMKALHSYAVNIFEKFTSSDFGPSSGAMCDGHIFCIDVVCTSVLCG